MSRLQPKNTNPQQQLTTPKKSATKRQAPMSPESLAAFSSGSKTMNSPVKQPAIKLAPTINLRFLLMKLSKINSRKIFLVDFIIDEVFGTWNKILENELRDLRISLLQSQVDQFFKVFPLEMRVQISTYYPNYSLDYLRLDFAHQIEALRSNLDIIYGSLNEKNLNKFIDAERRFIFILHESIVTFVRENTLDSDIPYLQLKSRVHQLLKSVSRARTMALSFSWDISLDYDIHFNINIISFDLPIEPTLNKISDIFAVSRTMLLFSYEESVLSDIDRSNIINRKFIRDSHSILIKSDSKVRRLTVFPKNAGVSFGGKGENSLFEKTEGTFTDKDLDAIENRNDSEIEEKGIALVSTSVLYIKCHRYYCQHIAAKNSDEKQTKSLIVIDSSTPKAAPLNPPYLNVSELFAYKILSELGIGPRVHFLIEPNLPFGIFIATEAADADYNGDIFFEEMRKLEDNKSVKKELLRSKDFIAPLTLVDLITRILYLSDMNTGNFGAIISREEDGRINSIRTMIIDFWIQPAIESYKSAIKSDSQQMEDFYDVNKAEKNFLENFLKSNTVIKYVPTSITFQVLNRIFANAKKKRENQFMNEHRDEAEAYDSEENIPADFYPEILENAKQAKLEEGKAAFKIMVECIINHHLAEGISVISDFNKIVDDCASFMRELLMKGSGESPSLFHSLSLAFDPIDRSMNRGENDIEFYSAAVKTMFRSFAGKLFQ